MKENQPPQRKKREIVLYDDEACGRSKCDSPGVHLHLRVQIRSKFKALKD